MSRSRLEKYLDTLEALIPEPLEFESIALAADIECSSLKQHLEFLMAHKLVEERSHPKENNAYAITERGLAVFKTLKAEEYFKKLRSALPVLDEASEIGQLLSRHSRETKDR